MRLRGRGLYHESSRRCGVSYVRLIGILSSELTITHNFRELRERCKAWIISKEQLTTSFET